MRIFAVVLAGAGLLAAAGVKDFSKTVPLDDKGRFTLDTYKGSIHITAWDQPQAQIQARIEEDPGWRAMPVEDVEIRVDASSGDVRVKTDYHRQFWTDGTLPFVHYTIRVPRGVALRIKDYKSESDISGVQGELEFETYKGRARIEGVAGALTLETYKGDIQVAVTKFAGPSRIHTYRGIVDVSLPRASAFDLRTSFERRAEFECDFPRTIHSTGRQTRIDGAVNGGGAPLHISSYRGNIRLRAI
ncbi:MAG TPA: DUF4097 family beta strand repeat-containing protein [Bryobacteraceae bacterium]|nr:DUF4097 family beta strand repeat-containing protein [Bryobacteraceae bacterium]